jgi:FAD/FMN-containing dehydrogenase/ferredoxin
VSPDLNAFFDEGRRIEDRELPPRVRELALALRGAVQETQAPDDTPQGLDARILTDTVVRSEYDRDQNVYLDGVFTRWLTHAVPDVVFQPLSTGEVAAAVTWARESGIPMTLRGAGTTAMGGSVPSEAGVVLDLSRIDELTIDPHRGVVVLGAGARFRVVHAKLAERGLSLSVYPSNLGGTYAGWLATGGIGLNSYGHGRAVDHVEWIEVVLPTGEPLRIRQDRTVQVPIENGRWESFPLEEAREWFEEMNLPGFTLEDWAGTEGQFGIITRLAVTTRPRLPLAGFLLGFARREDSQAFLDWIRRWSPSAFPQPTNLKWLSPSHVEHARLAWRDDDLRPWRRRPGGFHSEKRMPWSRLIDPRECGLPNRMEADTEESGRKRRRRGERFAAYVFVDFLGEDAGLAFCRVLDRAPGSPRVLVGDSLRLSAERFRPQSIRRFGPGLLAAEVLMPAPEVPRFFSEARRRARGAGVDLDVEVYYSPDDRALVIAGYLVDHRSGTIRLQLILAPSLTDLALRRYGGRPYVLGRWQARYYKAATRSEHAERQRQMKHSLDPGWVVNRGSYFKMGFLGVTGRLAEIGFRPAVRMLGALFGSALALPLMWILRGMFSLWPGPAWGRGSTAKRAPPREDGTFTLRAAADRAVGCVNCGECNAVCPIYQHSGIRLPQVLTHLGESVVRGDEPSRTGAVLLDFCLRCGNCEEVCQAGIPHLPLYESMQAASDRVRAPDRDRQVAILEIVRGSGHYTEKFLRLRPGGYQRRTPASLPGMVRYIVQRAENDDGPAATCIHCGACVPVCPTEANLEYQEEDGRLITTQQDRCIGCGTCVEVCPANLANGGQTLRVYEAPTRDWLETSRQILAQLGADLETVPITLSGMTAEKRK